MVLDWFDFTDPGAAVQLLRTAPLRTGYCLRLPAGWRDTPAVSQAAQARITTAQSAGLTLLVERYTYRWTPERGMPARPGYSSQVNMSHYQLSDCPASWTCRITTIIAGKVINTLLFVPTPCDSRLRALPAAHVDGPAVHYIVTGDQVKPLVVGHGRIDVRRD